MNEELKSALKIQKEKWSCDVIVTNVLCVLLMVFLLALLVVILINR